MILTLQAVQLMNKWSAVEIEAALNQYQVWNSDPDTLEIDYGWIVSIIKSSLIIQHYAYETKTIRYII